ncbi:hypothetical protein K488DRAFT_27121, partial [Vararia minispora EC-137]
PYARSGPKPKKMHQSSAKPAKATHRDNLTLYDWTVVLAWFDANQPVLQEATVHHFANRPEGPLIFSQGTLSHRTSARGRAELDKRLKATPTALDTKCARVVTRPDVDHALYLWTRHLEEEKKEHITDPMLEVKRARFEEMLNVPPEERMTSKG